MSGLYFIHEPVGGPINDAHGAVSARTVYLVAGGIAAEPHWRKHDQVDCSHNTVRQPVDNADTLAAAVSAIGPVVHGVIAQSTWFRANSHAGSDRVRGPADDCNATIGAAHAIDLVILAVVAHDAGVVADRHRAHIPVGGSV